MERAIQQQRAATFHQFHTDDNVLVLVNAWDAASARVIEQAGSPAIATTSAGIAWSLGYSDSEQLSAHELIAACERICRVATTPVSVDIERGYGKTLEEVGATVRSLIDIGVVGINIEDGVTADTGKMASPDILAERISFIRKIAQEIEVQLFINARTDTYFVGWDDPVARYEEAIRRAQIYVDAGADGIFVPGLESREEMTRMSQTINRPINIYAGYAGLPTVNELKDAGIRRVSLGCGPFQAALALTRRIATEALTAGTYSAMTTDMLSAGEVNNLF